MKHLLPITALFALAACSNNEDSTIINTADGHKIEITSDTEMNNESATIILEGKDGEGRIRFGDAAAKEGLPLGFPVYPGGEVKGAFMGGGSAGETGGMATVMTKAAPAMVVDFYRSEAERRGFKVETQSTKSNQMGDTASFSAKNTDGSTLVITATPDEAGGTAAVIIGGGKN